MKKSGENAIEEKLRAQYGEARAEYENARTELDIMLGELIGDLHLNLGAYVLENLKREIRKRPEYLKRITPEQLEEIRAELARLTADETSRIVDTLRNDPAWYDENVVFLEPQTSAWKTIQSIDAPANKLLKKHGIAPISLRNWNWLSDHLADLAERRYPPAKRVFIEKRKQASYIQSRLSEEAGVSDALSRLEEL